MRKLIALFALLYIFLPVIAQDIKFTGSAPSTVAANERFQITYTLRSQGEQGRDIRIPDVQGLNQLFGPSTRTQMNQMYANGQMMTEVTNSFIYTYLAPEPGTFTIPAATIKVGNSTYKSNELTIKAVPADQAIPSNNNQQQQNNRQSASQSGGGASIGNSDLFVRMHVSKRDVYENEGFLVTFKVYSRYSSMGFRDYNFPNFEGFISQEVELPQNQQWQVETYDGRQYYTATLKQTILYPIRSGKITIAPGKFEAEIAMRVQNDRVSFFDPIFTTQTVKKTLNTSATTLDVKPLPAGKPNSFTGAVGEYSLSSSLTPEQLKTDEVVTLKVDIKGSGNIKFVKNPAIVFPNDFDVLDPKVQESSKVTTSGVSGSKSIEYYAIPRYAGNFTIPRVEFSYFDIKSKTYKTLATDEYTIRVEQGEGSRASQPVIASSNKEDIKYLGQDIRHIKTGAISFHKGEYLWGSLNYWLIYAIPALLFIVFFFVNRKQAAQNANIALMRTKKANKVATKRLKLANTYLKENKKESFYEEISKAVWGYLGDKLNMPAAMLTKDNIESELSAKQIDPALISSFIHILNTAEFARFAPAAGSEAMGELYNSTVDAINRMENQKLN